MATDDRSVLITIKLDPSAASGDSDPSVATGATPSGGGSGSSGSGSSSSTTSATAKAAYVALAFQVGQIAINEIVGWAEYLWNRELSLNDDYIGQRNKQIAETQINRVISYTGTIGQYAVMGSKFGPVGAVVGATLGTVVTASQIARSNQQGWLQQEVHLRQMTAQLEFTRSRAGWSTQAASIGEDL